VNTFKCAVLAFLIAIFYIWHGFVDFFKAIIESPLVGYAYYKSLKSHGGDFTAITVESVYEEMKK
jgi:hypothetical protein